MPSAPCQVGRQQPTIRRRLGDLQYFGWRWPQVVGLPAHEAERRIKQDCPGVYCEVVSEKALLTMCYRSARVRIMVDGHGKVVGTPHVG